jgi:hypothetical protein
MSSRDGTLPVGFIVAVETKRLFGRAPGALAYVATFPNPVDALSAVKQLGGPNEKVKIVAEILRSTVVALGVGHKTVRLL